MSKVYIVTDGTNYKIGMTNNSVATRIKQLQTGCATRIAALYEAECYGSAATVEKYLHHINRDRSCVGEWFNMSEEELAKSVGTLATIAGMANVTDVANGKVWAVESLISLKYDVDKTTRQIDNLIDRLLVEMANLKFTPTNEQTYEA